MLFPSASCPPQIPEHSRFTQFEYVQCSAVGDIWMEKIWADTQRAVCHMSHVMCDASFVVVMSLFVLFLLLWALCSSRENLAFL